MVNIIKSLYMANTRLRHGNNNLKTSWVHFTNYFERNVISNSTLRNSFTNININSTLPNVKGYKAWSEKELDILSNAVNEHGSKWKYISEEYFQSLRKPSSILQKWSELKAKELRPSYYNRWTENEDKILKDGVKEYGVGKWKKIEKLFTTKDYRQIV